MSDENVRIIITGDTSQIEARLVSLTKRYEELGGKAATDALSKMNQLEKGINTLSGTSSKAHGVFGKLTQQFAIGTLAANAAASAISQLTQFIGDSTKAALEEEKQWNKMAGAIEATGGNVDILLPKFQALTDKLEMQTGVADTLISGGFAQMRRAGLDIAQSTDLMNKAIDIAIDRDQDLGSVIDTLLKAMAGKEGALEKLAATYGIVVEKTDTYNTILDKVTKLSAGAAASAMTGFNKIVREDEIRIEKLQEAIGLRLLPVMTSLKRITLELITDLGGFGKQIDLINDQYDRTRPEVKGYITESDALRDRFIKGEISASVYGLSLGDLRKKYGEIAVATAELIQKQDELKAGQLDKVSTPKSPVNSVDNTKLIQHIDAQQLATQQKIVDDYFTNIKRIQKQALIDMETEKRERAETTASFENVQFEASLIGYDKYSQELMRLEREKAQQELELTQRTGENKYLSEEEFNLKLEALRAINIDKQKAVYDQMVFDENVLFTQRYESLINITENAFTAMGNALTAWGQSTEQRIRGLFQSIVSSIVGALTKMASQWLIHAIFMKKVDQIQTQAKTNLAASNQAAAVIGIPFVGPALAAQAAATTKALLSAVYAIPVGFDDPINDAVALRSGRDYGKLFKQGANQELGSPNFGTLIDGKISNRSNTPVAPPVQLNINFHGDVYEASAIQTIMNKIKEELYYGRNTLELNPLGISG